MTCPPPPTPSGLLCVSSSAPGGRCRRQRAARESWIGGPGWGPAFPGRRTARAQPGTLGLPLDMFCSGFAGAALGLGWVKEGSWLGILPHLAGQRMPRHHGSESMWLLKNRNL